MRTLDRPESLGIYQRALPRGVRQPVPIPTTATLNAPPEVWAAILGMAETPVHVTELTVHGIPAVDFAVATVANGVAAMMTAAKVYDLADDEQVTPPIVERPHPLFGSFEWWELVTRTLLVRGNFVAVLADHDQAGWPRQAVPVDPGAVSIDYTSGLPVYRIHQRIYAFDEVVHVRMAAPVGTFWGRGIVERFRTSLRGQLGQQNYMESSYREGAVPPGILKLDTDTVTQDLVDDAQDRWETAHGSGRRKVAVFGRNLSFEALAWTPEDAEFIEARRISIAEAAYLVGLEPADLGATIGTSGQLTYQNINDRQLDRVTRAFAPIMQRIEQAWSDLLPGRQYVRGQAEALLRTTTMQRYEVHQLAQAIGLQTAAETRVMEKRPEIDETTTEEEETDDAPDDAAA